MSKKALTTKYTALLSLFLNYGLIAFSEEMPGTTATTEPMDVGAGLPVPLILTGLALIAVIVAVAVVVMAKNKNKSPQSANSPAVMPSPSVRKPVASPASKPPVIINVPKAAAPVGVSGSAHQTPHVTEPYHAAPEPENIAAAPQPEEIPVNPTVPSVSANTFTPPAQPAQSQFTPPPAAAAPVAAPAASMAAKPLFDTNKLEDDLNSIFSDPNASPVSEEEDKKSPLFDSNQLDNDLDALFVEVNKESAKPKVEEKKGLFDPTQLDSELDSLFSEPAPSAPPKQEAPSPLDNGPDLSSLFGPSEPASETPKQPESGSSFDLSALDSLNTEPVAEKKEDNFELPGFDLSSLTSEEPKKEEKPSTSFDLDSLDFMGGTETTEEKKEESFELPSFDLSSLTGAATPSSEPSKPDEPPKIDLSTTTMGLNIADYLNSAQSTKESDSEVKFDMSTTMPGETKSVESPQFKLSDTIPPQSLNVSDLVENTQTPVSKDLIDETSESRKKQKGEGIIAIGKMLVDQNALEEIIKKAEKGGRAGLTTTQVITAVKGRSLDTLLVDINNIDSIMGSIIVGKDGLVIANTMPPEVDKDLVGALTSSLFSNIDVQVKKLKKGALKRLTVETDIGIYILTEIEMGTLVVFSDLNQKVNLNNVFKAITTVTGKR